MLPALALHAASAGVGAQDKPAERLAAMQAAAAQQAIAWLQSDDPATIAWGAHAAAELRLTACIPELLARLAGQGGGSETDLMATLLDALIETGATVPAAELGRIRHSEAAVVLMARDPAANRAGLLTMFGDAPCMDDCRRACGNLLAGARDPEFVRALLRGPWQITIAVHDPGARPTDMEIEFADFASGFACSRHCAPKNFPRLARHRLTTHDDAGSTLVASGPTPVFRYRQASRMRPCERFSGYDEVRRARVQWLEAMLGEAQRAVVAAVDRPLVLEWRDRPALDAHARELRATAEASWRALVKTCVAAKLLAIAAEKEPMPAIDLEYLDLRKDRGVALPESKLWWRNPGK